MKKRDIGFKVRRPTDHNTIIINMVIPDKQKSRQSVIKIDKNTNWAKFK